jgi:Ca2+-binding EF-hand superfamily protein
MQDLVLKLCPLCRAPFTSCEVMPDPISLPSLWFHFIDVDGSGSLSREEIFEGLNMTLPLDPERIRRDQDTLWTQWDRDRDGNVSEAEFRDKKDGVLGYLLAQYGRVEEALTPTLTRTSLREWFRFWDADESCSLDKDELVRALVKTLRLEAGVDANAVRAMMDAIWFIFDSNGDGTIDVDEFVAPGALGDTLLATLGRA